MAVPPPTPGLMSPRAQLARVALEAALATEGVAGPHPGPHGLHVTTDRGTLLRGVLAAAEPGGRYSLVLGLTGGLVPLEPLADTVRARVALSAARAGVDDKLGTVDVVFHDVQDPLEALP